MRRWIALTLALIATACVPAPIDVAVGSLPEGDAARGEALFTRTWGGTPECSDCHSVDGSPNTGPTLLGFAEIAGSRRRGQDAVEYALQSITLPASFLTPGYMDVMPGNYSNLMTRQQLADLVAYMLTL